MIERRAARIREAAAPMLKPGEEVRGVAEGIKVPTPLLRVPRFLVLTDRRLLVLGAPMWSTRPRDLVAAAALSSVGLDGFEVGAHTTLRLRFPDRSVVVSLAAPWRREAERIREAVEGAGGEPPR